jgi:hypothetical protein
MTPLQFWLPSITSSLHRSGADRDMQRAFDAWRGESIVWMLPDLDRTVRWREDGWHAVAMPSERIEKIEVYHIGANQRVFGPYSEDRFVNGTVDGLLNACLGLEMMKLQLFSAPESLTLEAPTVSGSAIVYAPRTVRIAPYGVMPINSIDEVGGDFTARWPPESSPLRTISPDSESEARYGPFQLGRRLGDLTTATGANFGGISIAAFARWPKPLTNLVPEGDGMDIAHAWQKMRQVARQSSTDLTMALQVAKNNAANYISEGLTSRESAWYWPTFLSGGEQAVLFEAEDFGIQASSMAELQKGGEFRKLLSQTVKIQRVWGPTGLLWALQMQQLEDGRPPTACEICGGRITGKMGKKYCSLNENRRCFKRRRAGDQRKSRSGRA